MSGSMITINGKDGSFEGYLAKPAGGTGPNGNPGVVVIQEIFGVNQVMRDIADDLAAKGFVALCPDLFWRIEPGIQLTDQSEAEWARAFELFNAFDVAKGVEDLQATIDALRGTDGVNGKVGSVGYCLGGQMAFLTGTRTNIDAAVGFYGVNIPAWLGEAGNIKKPVMLHVAEQDEFVDHVAQAEMHKGLDDHPNVTLHDYPGMDHAFARVGGAHYDKPNADLANERTLAFFQEHLG